MKPWIGVDFDGTIAVYDKWRGADNVGAPITKMVERVESLTSIVFKHTKRPFFPQTAHLSQSNTRNGIQKNADSRQPCKGRSHNPKSHLIAQDDGPVSERLAEVLHST